MITVSDSLELQQALLAAADGDTIYLGPGEYEGTFSILRRDLTLVGAGEGITRLRGVLAGDAGLGGLLLRDLDYDPRVFDLSGEAADVAMAAEGVPGWSVDRAPLAGLALVADPQDESNAVLAFTTLGAGVTSGHKAYQGMKYLPEAGALWRTALGNGLAVDYRFHIDEGFAGDGLVQKSGLWLGFQNAAGDLAGGGWYVVLEYVDADGAAALGVQTRDGEDFTGGFRIWLDEGPGGAGSWTAINHDATGWVDLSIEVASDAAAITFRVDGEVIHAVADPVGWATGDEAVTYLDVLTVNSGNDSGADITYLYDDIVVRADVTGRAVYGEGWSLQVGDEGWLVVHGEDQVALTGVDRVQVDGVSYALVGQGAFDSIQAAIDAAGAGDTVLVAGGLYKENLVLDGKAVNLVAAGDAEVTLAPASGVALTLQGDLGADATVLVQGIDFADTVRGLWVRDGARLHELHIDEAHFSNIKDWGVRVGESADGSGAATDLGRLVISGSVFYDVGGRDSAGNGAAVKLWRFQGDLRIEDTEFTGHPAGATTRAEQAPASAIEIQGVDNRHVDEAVPIGEMVLDQVSVDGGFAKNPVGIFNFASLDGLAINGLDLSGAASGWTGLLNIDGIAGDVDASGFEVTFPQSSGPVTELQGEKSGDIDNVITGTSAADLIKGKAGDDRLEGRDGDDRLHGGDGDDLLDGGAGNDVAVFDDARAAYSIRFEDPFVLVTHLDGAGGEDRLLGIETLEFADVTIDLTAPVRILDAQGELRAVHHELGEALADALDGETVVLAAGLHVLAIDAQFSAHLDRAITLRGANAGSAGHEPRGAESVIQVEGDALQVSAAGVVIEGVELRGGVEILAGASDVVVRDSVLDAGTGSALVLHEADGAQVTGNVIRGATGVEVAGFGAITISGNHFHATGTGLALLPGAGAEDAGITGNLFEGGEYGVALRGETTDYADATAITIAGNTFLSQVGAAVYAADALPARLDDSLGASLQMNLYGTSPANEPGTAIAVLFASEAGDLIIGGGGDDTLDGTGGDDIIRGGGGDDVLIGGAGDDRIYGGAGIDVAVFRGSREDYQFERGADGVIRVLGPDGEDRLYGVEKVRFGDGPDIPVGELDDIAPVTIDVTSADALQEAFDALLLDGDWVRIGADVSGAQAALNGNASLTLDDAQDLALQVAADAGVANVIIGGTGSLSVSANTAGGVIDASALQGDATLGGGNGDDVMRGGAGNDTVVGSHGGGRNIFDGGTGSNLLTLTSAAGGVVLDLDAGPLQQSFIDNWAAGSSMLAAEAAQYLGQSHGIEYHDSGTDPDSSALLFSFSAVTGSRHDDLLIGGMAGETFDGYGGADDIIGKDGVDTVLFGGSPGDYEISRLAADEVAARNAAIAARLESFDMAADGFEAGVPVFRVRYVGEDPQLQGVDALVQVETLRFGTGEDAIDYAIVEDGEGRYSLQLPDGGAVALAGVDSEGDNRVHGGDGADLLRGGAGADTFFGGAGDDTLDGGAGDDFLDGGDGNDLLTDGAGSDRLHAGDGDDVLVAAQDDSTDHFMGGAGTDTVRFAGAREDYRIDVARVEVDGESLRMYKVTHEGTGTFDYVGMDVELLQFGDAEPEGVPHVPIAVIDAEGNEVGAFASLAGALAAASAGSRIEIEDGTDLSTEGTLEIGVEGLTIAGGASVVIAGLALGDGVHGLRLEGEFSTRVQGNDLDNVIIGNAGDNRISGGGGDDLLVGGGGNDVLLGGAGNDLLVLGASDGVRLVAQGDAGMDRFILDAPDDAGGMNFNAVINDFRSGHDVLDFGHLRAADGEPLSLADLGLTPSPSTRIDLEGFLGADGGAAVAGTVTLNMVNATRLPAGDFNFAPELAADWEMLLMG